MNLAIFELLMDLDESPLLFTNIMNKALSSFGYSLDKDALTLVTVPFMLESMDFSNPWCNCQKPGNSRSIQKLAFLALQLMPFVASF